MAKRRVVRTHKKKPWKDMYLSLVNTKHDWPIIFVFVFFLFCACGIVFRLYQLQVIEGHVHAQTVENQFNQLYSQGSNARGNIYFTFKDGSRLLVATDKNYYSLVINNRNISNQLAVREQLTPIVDFDQEVLTQIFAKENDPYEVLVRRVDDAQAQVISDLNLRGVELHVNRERYYPAQDLGSNIVGFTSFAEDELRGTYGLEKYYDNILRRDGDTVRPSIFFSLFNESSDESTDETEIEKHISKEGSLIATIEPNVQDFLEKELDEVSERFASTYSAGIVLDPDTGKVVAMAVSDNIDLNTEKKHFRNYLIEDRRELGSIMKPLSVAMALDAEDISTNFSYYDYGFLTIGKHTIRNFDRQGRGAYTTLQTILTQSLNTGVAQIALSLGSTIFIDYMHSLGFDSETGIDLPYEAFGMMANVETGRDVELATASFGQGIAPTPIEMARAWASLANEGHLRTPYVVDQIEYGDLIPSRNTPIDPQKQVFSSETAQEVTDMLVSIVDDSATFKPYSLAQHSIAIKTGTAQIPAPEGGYYPDQFLHSFAGYFPAQAKPGEQQFLLMLYTVKPQGARFSSTTLKDTFFSTAEYLINYYNVKPDRNLSSLDNIQ